MSSETNASELLNTALLPLFFRWYFIEQPIEIIKMYGAYAKAFYNVFSFTFLLKTLFAPWKKISDDYPDKGLNVRAITETFFLNLTARGIGLIVRMGTMVVGIVVQLAVAALFLSYLLVWIFFPVLAIAGIIFSFTSSIG